MHVPHSTFLYAWRTGTELQTDREEGLCKKERKPTLQLLSSS
jgi:hypothetical protein